MFRTLPYVVLFIVVLLLQIFIFDRLLISTALLPMVYVVFILLLPIHTPPALMLLWGVAVGAIFDISMGMSGINSIATIFLCYVRGWLLNWTIGRDIVVMSGAPSSAKIGWRKFFRYLLCGVLIHSVVLFSVEYLNLRDWGFLLRRIVYSSAFTVVFVSIIAQRFDQLMKRNI